MNKNIHSISTIFSIFYWKSSQFIHMGHSVNFAWVSNSNQRGWSLTKAQYTDMNIKRNRGYMGRMSSTHHSHSNRAFIHPALLQIHTINSTDTLLRGRMFNFKLNNLRLCEALQKYGVYNVYEMLYDQEIWICTMGRVWTLLRLHTLGTSWALMFFSLCLSIIY